MEHEKFFDWPSGDCKPVLATQRSPEYLVSKFGGSTFRDRDDLDWFDGAHLNIDGLGPVLIMKHDNNPQKLTALYVDIGCDLLFSEAILIQYFHLSGDDIAWRLSIELNTSAGS